MKNRTVELVLSLVIIFAFFMFMLLLSVLTLNDGAYYKSSGWSCSNDDFYERYVAVYKERIRELQDLYKIDCLEYSESREYDKDVITTHYLYNDLFTVCILFANRSDGEYAEYKIKLFYFGDENNSLHDYEAQENLVGFINELTAEIAFDAQSELSSNPFEALYDECVEEGKSSARRNHHFDHIVGYLGYSVNLRNDSHGYYYKMQKNSDFVIESNVFSFDGLLKP